ncbi:acidic phospholipase A2 PL-I-like isoform X2 [Mobula birostris]|uniref:acidic phospholipase A2 PL-I-like isoform X2 n=1 Tax=Mobula birostris TaxID=1983395 RepID=UPI003B27FC67
MLFRSCSFSGDTDDYSGRMGSTTHMMRCLGCNNFKFDFVPYGCRCRHEKRKSVIGNPVDVIDWCCLHHQRCYKSRHGEGCHALTHYRWSCVAGNLHCLSGIYRKIVKHNRIYEKQYINKDWGYLSCKVTAQKKTMANHFCRKICQEQS